MKVVTDFTTISLQITKHANQLKKLEYDIDATAGDNPLYAQLFDWPTPVDLAAGLAAPAVNSVPIKSWEAAVGSPNNYKDFSNGELSFANGIFAVISRNPASLTIGIGNDKFRTISAEVISEEVSGTTEQQVSDSAAVQTIWADGASHQLLRFAVTELNGDDDTRYVMLFAKSPVDGDVPLRVWTLASGATIFEQFGDMVNGNGYRPYSQDANHTAHNGCYLAISSTANVLATDGPGNFYSEYV